MKIHLSVLAASIGGKVGETVYKPQGAYASYHSRKTREHQSKDQLKPTRCTCWSWQYCDLIYQGMTDEQKAVWRDALKRNNMSAYDLWMKECLTLVQAGENPPDEPSVSGGYSTHHVQAGTEHELPEDSPCLPDEEPEPPVGGPCPHCDPLPPQYIRATITGLVGPPEVYNVQVTLPQEGEAGCVWSRLVPPTDYILTREGPTYWVFEIEGGAPVGNEYFELFDAPADCNAPVDVPWSYGFPPWGDQSGASVHLEPWISE